MPGFLDQLRGRKDQVEREANAAHGGSGNKPGWWPLGRRHRQGSAATTTTAAPASVSPSSSSRPQESASVAAASAPTQADPAPATDRGRSTLDPRALGSENARSAGTADAGGGSVGAMPTATATSDNPDRGSDKGDRSRSSSKSSGETATTGPSLDSVLPASAGGGTSSAKGSAAGGGGVGAPSLSRSATPPPPPGSAAAVSKPPLPRHPSGKSVAAAGAAKPQQQQAPTAEAAAAGSSPSLPPAPQQQKRKLTGMAAFAAADRSSFDVGSPLRPTLSGSSLAESDEGGGRESSSAATAGTTTAASAPAAASPAPAPAPPPPRPPSAPARSASLDAPVSQRQSLESAGSGGGRNSGGGGGPRKSGYNSGGGNSVASAASSAARSARSSFALEAADRPTWPLSPGAGSGDDDEDDEAAAAAQGAGARSPASGTSEEFYGPNALLGGVSSDAAAGGAGEGGEGDSSSLAWLPALETSAAFLPSLPSHLVARASSLALVPPDTPLPTSLLWRLWGIDRELEGLRREKGGEGGDGDEAAALAAAATAVADELASERVGSVMKVARLADGSAWALTSPPVHAALVQARLGGPAREHRELLASYASGATAMNAADAGDESGGRAPRARSLALAGALPTSSPSQASALASALASAPDDGYLMHNVGHHLASAGALPALARLLGDAPWLDAKLRSYGAAAVTADFRRALALAQQEERGASGRERRRRTKQPPPPADDDGASRCVVSAAERIRLLLAAFQMSAPAAVACPSARGVLGAQMASRLLAAEEALRPRRGAPSLELLSPTPPPPATTEGDAPSPPPAAARGLRTTTPSLQQAGGSARLVLRGHTSPVLKVLIAPNGVDVVAVAADGAVRVFDLEVGDCVLHVPAVSLASSSGPSAPGSPSPLAPKAAAAAPASSPATPAGAAATSARLRDGNAVEDAALDGSGRLLLTACADGVARVWDLAAATASGSPSGSACLVRELDGGPRAAPLHAAALCSSGRTAATAGSDGLLRIWDVEAGACAAALSAHSGAGIRCLAMSSDGGLALTGGEDFGAVAWDARRLRPQAVFSGHTGWVVAVALVPSPGSGSPGGSSWAAPQSPSSSIRRALTASHDGTARVWEIRSGACAHVLEGHEARLSAARASSDGSKALTASDDGTARLWCLETGACLSVLDPFRLSSPSRGGGWIADAVLGGSGGGASAEVADGEKMKQNQTLPPSIVAAACGDGHVAAYDASAGSLLALLPGHAGPALCVAATRRGRFVVTGGADGTARVWDLAAPLATRGEAATPLARKHGGRVCCIAVAEPLPSSSRPTLPLVVTVGDDGALAWSPGDGSPLPEPLAGGDVPTRWARASPDGGGVAVASPDGGLRAWRAADCSRGETSPTLVPGVAGGPGSRVRAFDAAPAAGVALLATYDSAVKVVRYGGSDSSSLFHLQSRGGGPGDGPRSSRTERGHPGVGHARLSADGLVAATASVDGSARLWCASTGACLAKLIAPPPSDAGSSPPPSPVVATSLSLDGKTLLTVGADGTANAWDLSPAVDAARASLSSSPPAPSPPPDPESFRPRVLASAGSGTVGGRLSPDGSRALLWCGGGGACGPATVWLLKGSDESSAAPPPLSAPVLVAHLESPTGGVSATAWSRDGRLAALGSADGTLRVVCTEKGRAEGFFMADAGVTAVAFCCCSGSRASSSSASVAVVGCDDGSVHFVSLLE